mgnify:FL=1
MQDFKLGPLDGAAALIVIVVAIVAALALVAVFVVNIVKAVKERNDQKEDQAENEFFAEYGVTGEELRLNQKIAQKRQELLGLLRKKKVKTAKTAEPIPEPVVQDEPVVTEEPIAEEPVQEPVPEPVVQEEVKEEPAPVEEPVKEEPVKEEVKVEPVQEPVVEPVKEEPIKEEPKVEPAQEPIPEPVVQEEVKQEPAPVEEPKKQGVAKPAAKKVVKKKPDDWSKYDGTYEGYYYDPEDACYYEGTPSAALAKKLAAKEAELEALNANKDKKVVIKKVAPPFAALKTPKNKRQAPKPVAGFDEAVIYGKYVIEHVDKEDGTQEWFYTLYDASGNNIYESSNYTTQAYCERAINRFKSHAIIGTYTIEAADGKFFFVLKRKTYVHKGSPQNTFEEANSHMREIKNFAQTDIVRVQ